MDENEKKFEEEINDGSDLVDPNEQEQAKPHNEESVEAPDVIEPAEQLAEIGEAAEPQTEPASQAVPVPIEGDAESSLSELPEDSSEVVSAEEDPAELTQTPVYHWNYDAAEKYNSEKKKKERSHGAMIYAVIMTAAFLVAFAALAFMLISNAFFTSPDLQTADPANPADPSGGTNTTTKVVSERIVYVREHDPSSGVLTTQELYNKCLPSVVSIEVSGSSSSGIGSGFIISSDGYIITANHVIEDMDYINVVLSTGESHIAQVIGGNEFTDLALLKINKTGLTPMKIGRSSDLLVGDSVVSIGTPAAIEFAGSLAEGVVSYNNRVLKITNSAGRVEKKMTVIQTNALVNPGNSGGPLINEYGEAVGIVTMKLNSTYYEGMCFAIPLDAAMPIINAMKDGRSYDSLLSAVSRYPAVLGISAESVNIVGTSIYGVEIKAFTSSSYDISQKMKTGDVITQINSQVVIGVSDLTRLLDNYDPGDTVLITFYRSGQQMTVAVTLGS